MHIVHVFVHVKPDNIEAFQNASLVNAQSSVSDEPGVIRFDVLQQQDDSSRFVLVEVYRTPEAAAQHKETPHYQTWRDTVADMMAEPRVGVKFTNLFPADGRWHYPESE